MPPRRDGNDRSCTAGGAVQDSVSHLYENVGELSVERLQPLIRAREEEVAREWEWLQDALNKVARGRSEEEEIQAFRLLQHQAMAIGQRRVELQIEMAKLEGHRT